MKKNYKPCELEIVRFDEDGVWTGIIWVSKENQTPILPFEPFNEFDIFQQ